MFPDRIRMKRLEIRLSQRELAEKIGTDQAHISRIERGERAAITVQTLVKLADVLRVSTDYLLGRDVTPPSHGEPHHRQRSSHHRKRTKSPA